MRSQPPSQVNKDKSPNYLKLEGQNYYERLGLTANATQTEIKASKKVLLKYHPDKNPSVSAKDEFGLIFEAYETLKDEQLKRVYDNSLQNGLGIIPYQAEYKKQNAFKYDIKKSLHDIRNVCISNNYVAIPVNGYEGGIYLYYHFTGEFRFKALDQETNHAIYYDVMISEVENLLYATTPYGIEVFSLQNGQLVKEFKNLTNFASRRAAILGENGKAKYVYDGKCYLKKINQEGEVEGTISIAQANKITLSSDEKYAIVSSESSYGVFIYNLKNGDLVHKFVTEFPVFYAEMSPDGRYIACGGNSKTVNLYDLKTGKCQQIPVRRGTRYEPDADLPWQEFFSKTPICEVHSLNFSPNNKYIIIGEWTYGFSIYSIDEKKIVYESERMPGYINNVFFTNNNRIIINDNKNIHNMPVPNGITITSHLIGADDVHLLTIEDKPKAISFFESFLQIFGFSEQGSQNQITLEYSLSSQNKQLEERKVAPNQLPLNEKETVRESKESKPYDNADDIPELLSDISDDDIPELTPAIESTLIPYLVLTAEASAFSSTHTEKTIEVTEEKPKVKATSQQGSGSQAIPLRGGAPKIVTKEEMKALETSRQEGEDPSQTKDKERDLKPEYEFINRDSLLFDLTGKQTGNGIDARLETSSNLLDSSLQPPINNDIKYVVLDWDTLSNSSELAAGAETCINPKSTASKVSEVSVCSDIDGTLLIQTNEDFDPKGRKYKLNHNLIQAWKEAGIKEITLMTNTGIEDIQRIYDLGHKPTDYYPLCFKYDTKHSGYGSIPCPVIIKYLEEQGFAVKVVTGSDLYYEKQGEKQGPGLAYNDLLKDDYDRAFNYYTLDQPKPKGAIKPVINKVGHPFHENKNKLTEDIQRNLKAGNISKPNIAFKDPSEWDRGFCKREISQYVWKNFPAKNVIYYEDESESIRQVEEQHQSDKSNFWLSTCRVQKIKGITEPKKYYLDAISNSDGIRCIQFRKELQKLIDDKSKYNPFLSSNKEKRAVLRNLLTMIEEAAIKGDDRSIADVIKEWKISGSGFQSERKYDYEAEEYIRPAKYSNAALIGHHRSIFLNNNGHSIFFNNKNNKDEHVDTGTEKAIKRLVKDYGDAKLGMNPRVAVHRVQLI